MFEFRDSIVEFIYQTLERLGLNTVYVLTIFFICVSAKYIIDIKRLKTWKKIDFPSKVIVISAFVGTFFSIVMSLLMLFNIVE